MSSSKFFLSASLAFALNVSPALAGPFGFDLEKNPLDIYPDFDEAMQTLQRTGNLPDYCDELSTSIYNKKIRIRCSFREISSNDYMDRVYYYVDYKEGKGICKIKYDHRQKKYKFFTNKNGEFVSVKVKPILPTILANKMAEQYTKIYGPPTKIRPNFPVSFIPDIVPDVERIQFFWGFLEEESDAEHGIKFIHIIAYNPEPKKENHSEDSTSYKGTLYSQFETNYC